MTTPSIKPSFKVEYAKSNRSKCKTCANNITKDTPRIGKLEVAQNFDGTYYEWRHSSCFFSKFRSKVNSSSEIKGLDTLRWDDQQKIKAKFGEADVEVESDEDETTFEPGDISIEYARSGRSKCKECSEKIANGDARLGTVSYNNGHKGKSWVHVKCFNVPSGLNCIEDITGYEDLEDEDVTELEDIIEKAVNESKSSKGKKKGKTKLSKEALEEKKRIEKLWKLKKELDDDYSVNELKRMLRENRQSDKGGKPTLIDRCADGMTNGAIPRCTVCGNGRLEYGDGKYKCRGGYLSSWSKCTNVQKSVERSKWKIPDWEEEEEEYSDEIKSRSVSPKKRSRKDFEKTPIFAGWIVALVGSTFEDKDSLVELIENNGGEISANVTKRVTLVITTPEEESKERLPSKLKTAKKYKIPIHHSDYIENEVLKNKAEEPPKKKQKIPEKHVQPCVDSYFDEAESSIVVGNESEGYYSATLSKTDLGDGVIGRNSFYILQILKKVNKNVFWLYRRWGRVGDPGTLVDKKFKSKDKAIKEFESIYLKFTGNYWDDRFDFEKQPGKYYPVEIDYGQDEDNSLGDLATAKSSKSSLHPRVASLVASLFDLEMFEETMKSMDMDVKEMPLGKLSKNQLKKGFDVLKEIKKILKGTKDDKTEHLLKDATNRFYTIIPHYFEAGLPPVLATMELVTKKIEHLEVLSDMEVATTMLKTNTDTRAKDDPLLVKYKMLKNDITPLEKNSDQWKILEHYLNITCQRPKLDVLDIYCLSRHTEDERFSNFNSIEKRKLLWHGTRTAVYAAILSGGMKIMPHSGGRVGKGLYFADIVSKSASYCGVWGGGEGYLLLSEVALGKIHTINRDDPSIRKPPNGFDSVLATGTIMPDPASDIVDENISISKHKVEVPQGKIIKTGLSSLFNHNEFLVYDEGQVHMKYLLKVRWN